MDWFRFYSDVVHDPKVQKLPPPMFKHWVNVMCLASANDPRGLVPPADEVAFALRITVTRARLLLEDLSRLSLLDLDEDGNLSPHNWQSRQFESDDVTSRVRRFRNKRNVTRNVSSNNVETPPDTEQNRTDPEQKQIQKTRVREVLPPLQPEEITGGKNIFRETERMLGRQLTGMECDKLREMEAEYSEEVWRYALRESSDLNKRSIRYLESVCKNNKDGVPDERGRDDNRGQRSGGVSAAERLTPGPGLEQYERDYTGRKLVDPWGDSGGPAGIDQGLHAAGLQTGRGDAQEGPTFSAADVHPAVPAAGRQRL